MTETLTTYQIILVLCGSGVGVTVFGFGVRAYINSIVRPKLYSVDGTSIYIPRAEYDKNTKEFKEKICEVVEFQNALKGYYIAKGVKF